MASAVAKEDADAPAEAGASLARAAVLGGVGRLDVAGEMSDGDPPAPAKRRGGERKPPGAPAFADVALRWGGPGTARVGGGGDGRGGGRAKGRRRGTIDPAAAADGSGRPRGGPGTIVRSTARDQGRGGEKKRP